MHELGIAHSILDLVRSHVPPRRAACVREVRIRVGDEAGVLVESLEFCFSAAVTGTPYAGAVLVVDRVPGGDLRVLHVDLDDEPAAPAEAGADLEASGCMREVIL